MFVWSYAPIFNALVKDFMNKFKKGNVNLDLIKKKTLFEGFLL